MLLSLIIVSLIFIKFRQLISYSYEAYIFQPKRLFSFSTMSLLSHRMTLKSKNKQRCAYYISFPCERDRIVQIIKHKYSFGLGIFL